MALISSGTLGLQDAGTNPSTNLLLDTGYNSLSLAADTSFGLFRAYQSYYDGEFSSWEYAIDTVADGTAYVYKASSSAVYHDSGHGTGFLSYSGFDASIGTGLWDYMSTTHASGQAWASNGIGLNASSSSTLGSLSNNSFTMGDGVTRTITSFGIVQNTNSNSGAGAAQDKANLIWFSVAGYVASSSDSFLNITFYNNSGQGITVVRSSGSYSYDGTNTTWTWDNVSDAVITYGNLHTGTATRLYIVRSSSTSYNNGIAEEFGGADSSNVHLSHYYKGGSYHNTVGIPTSGTLQFSDFYGKSNTAAPSASIYSGSGSIVYTVSSGYVTIATSALTVGAPNISSFAGSSNVKVALMSNINGTIYFSVNLSSGSKVFTNSGWTTLKVWKNSTGTGSPALTLNRTSMSFTVSNNGASTAQANWTYGASNQSLSSYFGTSNGSGFLEIT
jgi:hypothetical protein